MSDRLWTCHAPLPPKILDMSLTQAGQSAVYWQDEYGHVNEDNPVMRWCLTQHSGAFVAASFAAIAFYATLLDWLPPKLGKAAAWFVVLVHSLGAATWLMAGPGNSGLPWLFAIVRGSTMGVGLDMAAAGFGDVVRCD